MKKLVPIIFILVVNVAAAFSPNVWQDGLIFENVDLDRVYHIGDTVQISFTVVKDSKFFYNDSVQVFLSNQRPAKIDTIYFSKCEVVIEQPQVIQYRTKIVIPALIGDDSYFKPMLGGSASTMQSLKVSKYTAVLDETIDKNKEIAYYVDMTGKVAQELKGIGIVVYKDGTREKVIFE